MRVPIIRGIIDRRILVNYRISPEVLSDVLPPPFRPQLVRGFAVGGICLIRLKQVRPRWWPGVLGIASENAAHRIAVQWEQGGQIRQGVYIPRRDTSSRLNAWAGGRVFPGLHHHGRFRVDEAGGRYGVRLDSDDGGTHMAVEGSVAAELPPGSIFAGLAEASEFFEGGSLGYSATAAPGTYHGLELRTFGWSMLPLAVQRVESSFFEDRRRFPAGSVEFDSALLMRGLEHEWHARDTLCAAEDDGIDGQLSRPLINTL